MITTRTLLFAAAALLPLQPAIAQQQDNPDQGETPDSSRPSDDFHDEIVIKAPGLKRLDMLAGTSVVQGEELQRNLDGQLGEVLAKLPGVSASSFSPGASRPVLRGFSGERVKVLTDGIGSIDASSTSADHAVTIDPLVSERIEVVRGPAVLLYGSEAIGGAVNVIGKRIPSRVPQEAVHLDALAGFDTAADKREVGASVDVPLGTSVAFHVDGSWRKTGDLSIPGYVLSDSLRAEFLAGADQLESDGYTEEADEARETANQKGTLPNSATETKSLGTGIAFFSGDSNLGVSFGYYDTNYGVPERPGLPDPLAPEAEEAPVTIGLKQYRADLRGALDLGDGFFDQLTTRWGYSDYTHTEFEGDAVGTRFDVTGVEGRVELVQSERGGWSGSLGGQYFHQNFVATGEEAFVPPNKTNRIALFALQEVDLGNVELEAGGRYEHSGIDVASLSATRDFDTFSGALGLSYGVAENFRIGLNGSRAERAPSAQELFADGPHVATQQFEVGNPDLGTESSWGLEAYARGDVGPATLSLSVYNNWFGGFIFLADTGEVEDGLPVYAFLQQDATHFGIEGELSAPLYKADGFTLLADLRGDYVRATLSDGAPVPRIPPLSLLGALEAQMGHVDARAEVQWNDAQTRISPTETPTDGFTQVNLSLAWHPFEGGDNLTLMLQADNVFDVEARRHASFTKDFVPLAGRNFKLSARASF